MCADFRELSAEHGMDELKSVQVKSALKIERGLALLPAQERFNISNLRMSPTC